MPNSKVTFKGLVSVLKDSFKGFMDDNVMGLCGALSYATIFSIAPLMVVVIAIISFIYGADAVQGNIYSSLTEIMGADAALQIQNLVKSASLSGKSTWAAVIGVVTLIFGASAVFAQIQGSLNTIWGIKPKPKSGIIKLLVNRLLSFSLVLSIGFLLIVSLSLNAALSYVSNYVLEYFPGGMGVIVNILNFVVTYFILAVLFGYIFKVLPDARIRFKDVAVGALVTAALFMIGRLLISLYIGFSNFDDTFGASAAVIVILVWIYYSSLILYFGAEFTKAWAVKFGYKIYPDKFAVTTRIVEIEIEDAPVETINKETREAGSQSTD
ncbi:MAG: ribonuclease BN [Bacteroidetes bacterium 43-16]|nr:MAG: ribonuclease BN [Bacteroidetes bacterium 43-16]